MSTERPTEPDENPDDSLPWARPSRSAKAAGRRAKAAGDDAEAQVDAVSAGYAARGVAVLLAQHPAVRQVGRSRGATFAGVRTGKAPVDRLGALAGGRAVALEVKSASATALPLFPQGKPVIRPEQARLLSRLESAGAVTLVLVRIHGPSVRGRQPCEWWGLRWEAMRAAISEAKAAGAASIGRALLERHGVLLGQRPAWLEVFA